MTNPIFSKAMFLFYHCNTLYEHFLLGLQPLLKDKAGRQWYVSLLGGIFKDTNTCWVPLGTARCMREEKSLERGPTAQLPPVSSGTRPYPSGILSGRPLHLMSVEGLCLLKFSVRNTEIVSSDIGILLPSFVLSSSGNGVGVFL